MSVDLVLIHPGAVHGIYGILGDTLVAVEPPLWCRIIASFFLALGYRVVIIDQEAERLSPQEVADRVRDLAPRLVAIVVSGHQPSASSQQMMGAHAVAQAISDLFYLHGRPKTLMLGNHPSALPERTLREEPVDFVCDGEGPLTIRGLLDGDFLAAIPGLVWRYDGDVVRQNPRAPLLDMDRDLHGSFAWHLLPMYLYRAHNWQCLDDPSRRQPYASIHTTLGCSFKCHFCLAGDTEVNTIFGPIPIRDLVDRKIQEIPVFTLDAETLIGKVATAYNIKCYGMQKLVRVNFDDGSHIDCTPDHKFLQFKWGNGRGSSEGSQLPCEAKDLKPGDHVRAIKFGRAGPGVGYPCANWTRKGRSSIHRMVAEWKIRRKLTRSEHVHHLDHDRDNWSPDNLVVFGSAKEHFAQHPEIAQRMRDNNPTKNMTPEWGANISAAITGLRRSPQSIENYRAAAIKREASMKGKTWWTEPDGSCHLSVSPKSVEARRGRNFGFWWTTPEGKTYQNPEALHQDDVRGRRGFNPHKPINHRVISIEELEEEQLVYCLDVPETGWFYANNVLVKNCMINVFQHQNLYRRRSPQAVVDEMLMLYSTYGVRTFKITDELFVLNRAHFREICHKLIASGIADDINVWAYSRTDTVRPDDLPLLRAAGVKWLALGIESGSAEVRAGANKALRHDENNADIRRVVTDIRAAGINVIANYIVGLRDDTRETMEETYQLAASLNTEFMNVYCAQAYPGSPLYDQAIAEGWTLPPSWAGFSQHNEHTRPLDTKTLPAAEVLQFRDAFFSRYFGRPEYHEMIIDRFGPTAAEEIQKMTSYTLTRNLLK